MEGKHLLAGAVVAVLVGAGVAAALGAFEGDGGGDDGSVPTFTRRDSAITVRGGEDFVARLPANRITGYEWDVAHLPGRLELEYVRPFEEDEPPARTATFDVEVH